ncbi:hypothetical protein EW026_g4964 [Hermanssonia centrifuga]|uniref:Uncharacterized protein n=1 Tax=Hermanssonia centrifuga TaxID=98765 RepID=A0A4S4KFN0_9APHY|nr:hypothetical protein EW026_g4964 [Hermanssonia centrifuga]
MAGSIRLAGCPTHREDGGDSYYTRNRNSRIEYQQVYNAVRRPLRRKVSKEERARLIEEGTRRLTGECSGYANGIVVKDTKVDPEWTPLQQMMEKRLYDELLQMAATVFWTTQYDPSKPLSKFWGVSYTDLADEVQPRLELEVQRVRDSLELYEIEGEWNGRTCSKATMKEDVYSRVQLVACLHEAVQLLREGNYDRALHNGALVYCGRRVHWRAFRTLYGF